MGRHIDENDKEYDSFFDPKSIDGLNRDKLDKDIAKIRECVIIP